MASRKKPPLDPRLIRAGARRPRPSKNPSSTATTNTSVATKTTAGTKAGASASTRATMAARATTKAGATSITAKTPPPVALTPAAVPSHPLIREVITLTSRLSTTFYSIGVALRRLSDPEVYRPLGYKSQNQVLATEGFPHPRNARKAIAIVNALDEATALSLGFERAHSLVQYARHLRPNRPVMQFLATKPVVRIEGRRLALVDLTRDQLEALLADHRRGDAAGEVHSTAKRAARALGQLLEHAGLDSATVSSARKRGGSVVRIQVSPEDANLLAAILRDYDR